MNFHIALAAAPCLLCAAASLAQTAPPAPERSTTAASARPDPTDARAAVPPARHRSVLTQRLPLAATEPGDWRRANDTVHQVGGWRAYAREAAAAASAPASSPTPGAQR